MTFVQKIYVEENLDYVNSAKTVFQIEKCKFLPRDICSIISGTRKWLGGRWGTAMCGLAAFPVADQPTEAVNFTNDFSMVFNSPFRGRENVRADGKVNVTFIH